VPEKNDMKLIFFIFYLIALETSLWCSSWHLKWLYFFANVFSIILRSQKMMCVYSFIVVMMMFSWNFMMPLYSHVYASIPQREDNEMITIFQFSTNWETNILKVASKCLLYVLHNAFSHTGLWCSVMLL
jgi:K+-sensing histidine kinase KdpD